MSTNNSSSGSGINTGRRRATTTRRALSIAVASASALLLASCSVLPGGGGSEDETPAAPASAAPTSVETTVITTTETATEDVEASSSAEAEDTQTGGAIDEVQIVIDTTREVSPGVLQYSNYGEASGWIEWQAVSGGALYDAEQCVAVVSLVDQSGTVLLTDRQNKCEGKTKFDLRPSKNPPGEYRIDVSLAPWEDPDNPTEASSTFEMIAYGN